MENTQQIHEVLFNYVKENTYKDTSNLATDSMLFVEGILDSMGFALLLDFLEETFKFSPADSDLIETNFESIDAITDFVLRKQTAAAA
ncbi:MAG: acyl carrier protein [Bacteroidetes bacterium]|nr:acyl carrier protein [Bacteroidota bacterium]